MTIIGSLFSGYGGLDLGVQAVFGGEIAWHVEFDAAPSKILDHRFPGVPNYGDVTKVDWRCVSRVDIVTAGYPCQPFSVAGKRKGSNDERHLWPYVLDAVRILRPGLVVLENVRGHLTLGFDRVLGDLAEAGYDTQWICLRAADAGAPHRRERVFIVAQDANRSVGDQWRLTASEQAESGWTWTDTGGRGGTPTSDPCGDEPKRWGVIRNLGGEAPEDEDSGAQWERLRHTTSHRGPNDWGIFTSAIERWEPVVGRFAPAATVPDGRGGGHRLSALFVEWMMGLPQGWVTSKEIGLTRKQQLKALGNGVVPQQAVLAIRTLLEAA